MSSPISTTAPIPTTTTLIYPADNPLIKHYNPHKPRISFKDIVITPHARQRAKERLGITKDSEIQKLAVKARYNGIGIWLLSKDNYERVGLTYDMYTYLKQHYGMYHSTDKMYFYKEWVFVFAGKRSRTLVSIVPAEGAGLTAKK